MHLEGGGDTVKCTQASSNRMDEGTRFNMESILWLRRPKGSSGDRHGEIGGGGAKIRTPDTGNIPDGAFA